MKTLILLFCNLMMLQNCNKAKSEKMTSDNFKYAVTVTAPTEYPCEVYIGYLADDSKNMITGIPKTGLLQAGWNGDGAKGGMGGSIIPSHINLTYLAYAEKKFYTIDAILPKDKIQAAFQKGFLIQGKKNSDNGIRSIEQSTYDTFSIGLAPGGIVVIFLGGRNRIEICRLQAKETFVDKNDFIPHPDPDENQQQFFDIGFQYAVPDSIQTQIKEKGIPNTLYDDYRKKYQYRFVFEPYDDEDVILRQYNRYYNGEVNSILQPEEIAKKEYKNQGIPYNIEFIFSKYNTEIIFNDQEMLSVFESLQRKHLGKPMDVLIKPTFMYEDFKLSVKCEEEVIPLTKYKVRGV